MAFRGLDKLSEINIAHNELRGIDAEMMQSLPVNVAIVRLHKNPWSCDCKLRWLRSWLQDGAGSVNWDFVRNSPTCAEPPILRDVGWRHIGPDKFACPSVIVNTAASLRVRPGSSASIDCLVLGDPEPTIRWTRMQTELSKEIIHATTEFDGNGNRQVRSSVRLTNISRTDAGQYKCSAENSAGRSEVTYNVWIEPDNNPLPVINNSTSAVNTDSVGTQAVVVGSSAGVVFVIGLFLATIACAIRRKQIRKQKVKVNDLVQSSVHCSGATNAYDHVTIRDDHVLDDDHVVDDDGKNKIGIICKKEEESVVEDSGNNSAPVDIVHHVSTEDKDDDETMKEAFDFGGSCFESARRPVQGGIRRAEA